MLLKRITAALTAFVFVSSSSAMNMQEVFDGVNAEGNVSNPAVLQGQTMNLYSGGSLFMRMPKRSYNLTNATPPSWSAGCGGIDLYAGGFSFINKDQFVAMLQNIGSNALGYGFKLAIQNLCPTCDNVMQNLQAVASAANRLNVDACEAAKGVVNASTPEKWRKDKVETAKGLGVFDNVYSDFTNAASKLMSNEGQTNKQIQASAVAHPEIKDQIPTGNVVWKALKKMDGISDEQRMVLMSMIGSVIFPTPEDGTPSTLIPLMRKEINVETLVGTIAAEGTLAVPVGYITIPIWKCKVDTDPECLAPVEATITTKSYRLLVEEKMGKIADHIANRSAYDDLGSIIGFLNATDLPVYKMLAVTTTLGNTTMADALIGKYKDLIAAKYAQVYIERATHDLQGAIAKFAAVGGNTQIDALKELEPRLNEIRNGAKQVLTTAYSQTVSTYNIAQEVQYMERALNANLSQTLRQSLAFSKSLR